MTNTSDSRSQQTVLVVEDKALLRRTMCEILQDAVPDFDFLGVGDGAGALEACDSYRPVLVLMDKCLPDADGIELTARLKRLYPGIQIIVMSYRSGEIYVQRALAAGARGYLVKENLTTELIPAVAAAIGVPLARYAGTSQWKT
jgi:DNA-binding NarL/FixJ family response regulator